MQNTLDQLSNYSLISGFQFSSSKTQAIVFDKGYKTNYNPRLFLGNDQIKIVTEVKILGLIFDKKLTWNPHIEELKKQCQQRLNILKVLSAKNWGACQKVLTNTFKSLIQSKIDYGCAAYESATTNTLKKLDVILNTGMRIATGAYRTSPICNILSESNMTPLHLRRKKLILKYATKIMYSPKNQVHPLILKRKTPIAYKKHIQKNLFILELTAT